MVHPPAPELANPKHLCKVRVLYYAPFPDTHWSLVHRAGIADEDARKNALTVLLRRYSPALGSYMRVVKHLPDHVVDDLLASFIADKFLQQAFLQHADSQRGRFRAFLLTSLNHYISSSARQFKLRMMVPLPAESEPLDCAAPSPASVAEANWARSLILNVIEEMRQECLATHRRDIWSVFEGRVLAEVFENRTVSSYETLASELDLASPTQAANLLVTAKRMYSRLLKKAIGEYEPAAGVADEIAELRAILRRGSENR